MADWPRRILLQPGLVRQRERRQGRLLRIAGPRRRTADRPYLQGQRRLSGLFERQGLQGIRLGAPPRGLERLGYTRALAGRGKEASRVETAAHREVTSGQNNKSRRRARARLVSVRARVITTRSAGSVEAARRLKGNCGTFQSGRAGSRWALKG